MKKSEFYQTFGHELEITNPGDAEYGEHLILHPEEKHIAQSYHEKGHEVFTVYEESSEGGEEYVENGFDSSSHPYKVGYLILKIK